MKKGTRAIAILGSVVAGLVVLFVALSENGVFDVEVWKREAPLRDAITVADVRDGMIRLVDGRTLRPAGVARLAAVPVEDYDRALRVIVAQGVTVIRDLGDGRAFLLAEPKFYNWCGTRNYNGNPWARWAGSYYRCPVSELLIQSAYATPALDQAGLTARERWRLEGVEHIGGIDDCPTLISERLGAFRYDGNERELGDYDATLGLMWKPPPSP